jgi:transposase
MRGKKGTEYVDPLDPPRCRANIHRGGGTYANDHPPALGLIGRESGQVRLRVTVRHGAKEWARDEDGDGWFETPTNSTEGMWTGLRHFLSPFRGVHKRYLHGYVAVHESRIHLKAISPVFIAALVRRHSF